MCMNICVCACTYVCMRVKGKTPILDVARTAGYRCARSSEVTIWRKVGRRGWRSRKGGGIRGKGVYVSAYNPVSHSRAQALGQVAIDGTSSLGKWPVPSPGPPDSLVEDRPLCRDRTSASQTLAVPAGQPLHPSLSGSSFMPFYRAERIPRARVHVPRKRKCDEST